MKLSGLFVETMDKVESMLSSDLPIRGGTWTTPEVEMIKEKLPQLITTKPIVYLVNLTKKDFVRKRNKWLVKIHEWIKSHGGGVMIPFSVEFEQELWDLRADEEAQKAFLETTEGAKSALPKMVVQVRRRRRRPRRRSRSSEFFGETTRRVVSPSASSARAKFCARGFFSAASTFYVRESDRAG